MVDLLGHKLVSGMKTPILKKVLMKPQPQIQASYIRYWELLQITALKVIEKASLAKMKI